MGHVQRRQFLTAAGALLATPLARAQQPRQKVRRIGFLSPLAYPPPDGFPFPLFLAALRRHGYEAGKNLVIEARWTAGSPERLAQFVEELVRLDVELIVTVGNESTDAVRKATQKIPIVMWTNYFVIERGVIASYARPGGNVTGNVYAMQPNDWVQKTFQLLKEAVPTARRSAHIRHVDSTWGFWDEPSIARSNLALGMSSNLVRFGAPADLEAVFAQLKTIRPEVMHVSAGSFIPLFFKQIAAFAIDQKIVSLSEAPLYVRAGGCLRYGLDPTELVDQVANFVDKILGGAKPANLSVVQPTKFVLAMNATTARAIGLKPPESFMVRVDQVIE
jgi:putative ABC transport system substrate-binding protein